MKTLSENHISMLQSDNYQRPNIWDDKVTPYLLYKLPVSIFGGFIGAILVYLFVK
jgi:hypothetical protein